MANPQFNLRLRDGLDGQVRRLAAHHGVEPRVVVEDALIGHYGMRREGPGVDPSQLAFATETPLRADDGPAPSGQQAADQRGDARDPAAPVGRRRARAKAGEAGTSGQRRRRAVDAAPEAPAAETATVAVPEGSVSGGPPEPSGRGCPECAGELHMVDDSTAGHPDVWWRCEDCDYTTTEPPS